MAACLLSRPSLSEPLSGPDCHRYQSARRCFYGLGFLSSATSAQVGRIGTVSGSLRETRLCGFLHIQLTPSKLVVYYISLLLTALRAYDAIAKDSPSRTFNRPRLRGCGAISGQTRLAMTSKRGNHVSPRFMSEPPLRIAFLHPDLGIGALLS